MKLILLFIGFLYLSPTKVSAQITMMEIKESNKNEFTEIESNPSKQIKYVYDSLRNVVSIHTEDGPSFRHLIGQTLLFCGNRGNMAWSKKTFAIGDYYRVDSVCSNDPARGLYGRLLLTNLKTNEHLLEESNKETEYNYRWVSLGHYEKMKSLYLGKEFVYITRYNSPIPCKVETGSANFEIKEGSLWKCVDVQVNPNQGSDLDSDDYRSPVVLIIDNPKYGKHFCYLEDKYGDPNFKNTIVTLEKPLVCGMLQTKSDYERIKSLKQMRKVELVEKYGAKNAKDIMNGIIRIGMTKEMCRSAWGNPERINRTTTRYGTSEQWVYYNNYVYFRGNVITAIQD